MKVSVLLITLNEEENISKCLDSVAWSDDIVVVDSYSTDNTEKIARSFKQVRFYRRKFDDYSSQRNYGLHEIKYKNEMVLILDADEVCSGGLMEEIKNLEESDLPVYFIRRRNFFNGRWMKHNTTYPVWFGRLVNPKEVSFERIVNERLCFTGKEGYLKNHIDHFPFSKGLDVWIKRQNRYSSMEAEILTKSNERVRLEGLLSKNPVKRRKTQKDIMSRLPGRWIIYLLYNFFIKLCFIDGIDGVYYVLLRAFHVEFAIESKYRFMRIK
ncbi:MAG: glycosyltransferase family 2 protein [Candidatus Altiarchaeota archaeon]|nr:glycosyltransferase family 2 protein [Candidatus Altiarchaeota archaeon]